MGGGGGQHRHGPDSKEDETRLVSDKAAYTRAEFIAYYGVARGEAERRAAGPQPRGGAKKAKAGIPVSTT